MSTNRCSPMRDTPGDADHPDRPDPPRPAAGPAVRGGLGSDPSDPVRGHDRPDRDRRGRGGHRIGRHDGRIRGVRAPVHRPGSAGRGAPRPRARDHRLPRRPVLAARGRALGHRRQGGRLPVATLFGGSADALPVYASCGMLLPAAARAESALALRAEGFRALKIRWIPRRLEEGWRLSPRHATRWATRWRSWSTSTRAGAWQATPAHRCDPVAAARDRPATGRLRRPVGGGAAGRHGPARTRGRCGRPRPGPASPAAR